VGIRRHFDLPRSKYDTEHKFYPATIEGQAEANTWLAYQISGLGPSQGQVNWFLNQHPEKIPSAIERYQNESRRIYAVLEERLSKRAYFLDNGIGIVDFAFYPWVRIADYAKVSLDPFPHVRKWLELVASRESVKKIFPLTPS